MYKKEKYWCLGSHFDKIEIPSWNCKDSSSKTNKNIVRQSESCVPSSKLKSR